MMYRHGFKIAVIVALLLGIGLYTDIRPAKAVDQAQDVQGSLMQQKLDHAQSLLGGLALEDFDSIAEHAKALHQISIEADWASIPSKEYGQYGNKFREAASKVEQAAGEGNLDSAAWHYMQVVVTCVECHKAVRGQQPAEVAMLLP
jgi:hypothetical protein